MKDNRVVQNFEYVLSLKNVCELHISYWQHVVYKIKKNLRISEKENLLK